MKYKFNAQINGIIYDVLLNVFIFNMNVLINISIIKCIKSNDMKSNFCLNSTNFSLTNYFNAFHKQYTIESLQIEPV